MEDGVRDDSRGKALRVGEKVGISPIKRKKRPKSANGGSQDEAGCWLRENGKYTWKKLGRWGDPAVKERYLEVCQHFYVERASRPDTPLEVRTLAGLFAAFLQARKPHISNSDWEKCKTVARITVEIFPDTNCADFESTAYRRVQTRVARLGEEVGWVEYTTKTGKVVKRRKEVWTFWYANSLLKKLKAMLSWGTGRKLFPAANLHEIREVPPIGEGDEIYNLRVAEEREDVPDSVVRATLPFLRPMIADMVRLQRAACMRPSEICALTVADIQAAKDGVVCFKRHKTARYRVKRYFCFTPSEMELLRKYCSGKELQDAVFDPRQNQLAIWRGQVRHSLTDAQWLEKERRWNEILAKRNAFWAEQDYNRNVQRAIRNAARAGITIPAWTVYQLRHASVTANSQALGHEAAAFVAGHKSQKTTEIYDHKSRELATEAARIRGTEWVD